MTELATRQIDAAEIAQRREWGDVPDVVAGQVEVGEIGETLECLHPFGADVVDGQVEAGEIDEALERLRPFVPDVVPGQIKAGTTANVS